jgi:hypothetical protein
MIDYTQDSGPIVRNGRWPAGANYIDVILIRTENGTTLDWPAGVTSWTWEMLLSRDQFGGTPDLTLTASTKSVSGHILTLQFTATATQTNTIPGTDKRKLWVQIKSTNGAVISFYGTGRADVESAVGEA